MMPIPTEVGERERAAAHVVDAEGAARLLGEHLPLDLTAR
jgi:hypothetical protein